MKRSTKFISILCLILTAMAIFTACATPDKFSAEQRQEIARFENDNADFTQEHQTILETIANKIIADDKYALYTVSPHTGVGEGYCSILKYVTAEESPTNEAGKVVCDDETLLTIGVTNFRGDISYVPGKDVVSFRPAEQPASSNASVFITYCASEAGVSYLETGFLPDTTEVTVTHITGNWYLVTA